MPDDQENENDTKSKVGRPKGLKLASITELMLAIKKGNEAVENIINKEHKVVSKKTIDAAIEMCNQFNIPIPAAVVKIKSLHRDTPDRNTDPKDGQTITRSAFKNRGDKLCVSVIPVEYLNVKENDTLYVKYENNKITITSHDPDAKVEDHKGSTKKK